MISFELSGFPKVILLGRRICDINWGYSSYNIQNYELIFVYQGEAYLTIDGESLYAAAGDCVILKPNEVFSARTNPENPCKYYILHFNLDYPVEEISIEHALAQINQSIYSNDYKEISDVFEMPQTDFKKIYLLQKCSIIKYKQEIYDILESAIFERNRLNLSSETMIAVNLCEILILLSRLTFEKLGINIFLNYGNKISRPIQEAIFFIHDNYMKQIGLEDICNLLNVSPQYLIRAFRKYLNRTPLQYINRFRISRAKELLKYTSLYIKEISCAVGIQNPYYFCRLFKETENMTPTEFRNQSLMEDSCRQ